MKVQEFKDGAKIVTIGDAENWIKITMIRTDWW